MTDRVTVGRRVADMDELDRPGDYCGPRQIVDGDGNALGRQVWFFLPIANPADPWQKEGRYLGSGLHAVQEPPWTFRECPDGSLEIRASIACGRGSPEGEYWHGYLDEGHRWREC